MADRVGQPFGNYRLTKLLGSGGFADVYLGQHIYVEKLAAIKVLHARVASDSPEWKKFQEEARKLVKLEHPNIVGILDFGIEAGIPYLVMPYAPQGTLRDRHLQGERVPPATVISYIKQVASALQYAHDQQFIHRDIKPENLLIGARDEVLVSDFGIATIAESTSSLSTKDAPGTLPYMSPEQMEGKPHKASDQYSLAIVTYEWLVGERPFRGSASEIVAQHLSRTPPPLRQKNPAIPPAVEKVVLTALAKDPKDRFASMRAFAAALEQANRPAPPPVRPPAPIQPPPQANPSSQFAPPLQRAPAPPAQPLPETDPIPHLRRTIQGEPPPPFSTSPPRPVVPPAPELTSPRIHRRWAKGLLVGVLVLILLSGSLLSLLGVGFAGKGPLAFLGKPTLGTIKEFALSGYSSRPIGITKGADGNLWLTEYDSNQIGRITPAGKITEFVLSTGSSSPEDIVNGPDGSLWFTEASYILGGIGGEVTGNRIGRITPGGSINEFPLPTVNSDPYGITTGPDGNLWFTELEGNQIGRITPGGKITEFALPTANSHPYDITTGQDGNLWFTEYDSNQIGRITSTDKITEFAIPTVGSYPFGITAGPDGNLWFTESNGNKIGWINPGP
ncbi:MAG TPA: protein kinase [Ktedonobacterales bacterium]